MSTVAGDLAKILSTVRRPGDFYAAGRIELLAPRIEVEGVGPIALPLAAGAGRAADRRRRAGALRARAGDPGGHGCAPHLADRAGPGARRRQALAARRSTTSSPASPTVLASASRSPPSSTSCSSTTRAASSSAIATPRRRPACSPRWSWRCLRVGGRGTHCPPQRPRGRARPAFRGPLRGRLRGLLRRLRARGAARHLRMPR